MLTAHLLNGRTSRICGLVNVIDNCIEKGGGAYVFDICTLFDCSRCTQDPVRPVTGLVLGTQYMFDKLSFHSSLKGQVFLFATLFYAKQFGVLGVIFEN